MPFTVEMTGAQDYQRKIKMAVGGYPGAGKTLFSSTAPIPFFIFFREQPRIMSIAERYLAHTKVTNKYDSAGRLKTPVWDILLEVIQYLESEKGASYQTVVVDTGDELFQSMKEGKKAQNRGKWSISDWGWIADMYREMIARIIDLEKHVIVTYHLKQTQEGDDGQMFRELALQGAAKDEAPGWFDIVGVLDSWEEETDKGTKIPHRGILLQATQRYPFVKDHSGKLGRLFELSDDFVGDFTRMDSIIYSQVPKADHEILEEVTIEKPEAPPKTSAETGVPTKEDLVAKKEAKATPAKKAPAKKAPAKKAPAKKAPAKKAPAKKKEAKDEAPDPVEPPTETDSDGKDAGREGPATDSQPEPVEEHKDSAPEQEASKSPVPDDQTEEEAVTPEEALENVEEGLDGTIEFTTCGFELEDETLCGESLVKAKTTPQGEPMLTSDGEEIMIPDRDLIDLTMIRFRKHMCREHFTQARKG